MRQIWMSQIKPIIFAHTCGQKWKMILCLCLTCDLEGRPVVLAVKNGFKADTCNVRHVHPVDGSLRGHVGRGSVQKQEARGHT